MRGPYMHLTSGIIKGLKTKEKIYSVSDGNCLYMTVKPNDKRILKIRYSFNGKSNKTTLGSYPLISLKDAVVGLKLFAISNFKT